MDLDDYLTLRSAGLARTSIVWNKKSAELLWNAKHGVVSVTTLRSLRDYALTKIPTGMQNAKSFSSLAHFCTILLRPISTIGILHLICT